MTQGDQSDHPAESSISAHPERFWNYRAIRFEHGEDSHVAVHEVYYEAGKPVAYADLTAPVMWFEQEGPETGFKILARMREALEKPVLTEADFERREYRLLGTLRGSDIPADFNAEHDEPERVEGEGGSALDDLDAEMKVWDSMPAVGRERFWEPSANRYPFKARIELKRITRGAHLEAKGAGAAKRAHIKKFLRRADPLRSLKGRFGQPATSVSIEEMNPLAANARQSGALADATQSRPADHVPTGDFSGRRLPAD